MLLNAKTVQGWTFLHDRDTAEITASADGTHIALDITHTDATYRSDGFSHISGMEPFRDADSATGLRQTVEITLHNATSGDFRHFTVMTADLRWCPSASSPRARMTRDAYARPRSRCAAERQDGEQGAR
jgi:hypothetical protein